MADISRYLRNIEEATLGEEVRGSIHDAIKAINEAAEEGIEQASARVGTPVPVSTAASMEDTNKIYLYTGEETGYTADHWYYYDGSAWADGGAYNSPEYDYDRLYNKPPIVVVDDDTPTDSRTNVWFDPTGEEIEVPTMSEFNALVARVEALEENG